MWLFVYSQMKLDAAVVQGKTLLELVQLVL